VVDLKRSMQQFSNSALVIVTDKSLPLMRDSTSTFVVIAEDRTLFARSSAARNRDIARASVLILVLDADVVVSKISAK
jgi:hypothetical protein